MTDIIANILLREIGSTPKVQPVTPSTGLGAMTSRKGITAPQEEQQADPTQNIQRPIIDIYRKIVQQEIGDGSGLTGDKIPYDPLVDTPETLAARGYNPDEVLRNSVFSSTISGTKGRTPKDKILTDIEDLIQSYEDKRLAKKRSVSKERATASSSILDVLEAELMRGMTSKQTDTQPTVSADSSRDRFELQGDMIDLPVLDDEDAPDADTRSNELLDKELPSAGLGSRPVAEAQTDDDMGLPDIPTFGVGSRKFNSSVVDEMVSLEGMGGDDLSATPTYSYGITKEKADKYNLVPESFNTMREFADAFADKYIEEKYNANKSIFDNVDSEFHKPLMSYLWNVGSFGTNQRKALSKKNPDVREFIKEMRDAVHSEGFASSGLSARRAKEANLLGEGLANWEDIVKVEVSGTKEKPVFKWVTASGNVVEEFASGKKLHPNNKLSDVTL